MKHKGRYQANSSEGEYQPGSNDEVLKNLLSITDPLQMELLETEKLLVLTDTITQDLTQDQTITSDDIISMHEDWLSEIYVWAGQYRSVIT